MQCGVDPLAAYEKVEGYVKYLHVKDAYFENGEVVPAGKGDGRVAEIIKRFARNGGEKFLSLEPHLTVFDGLENRIAQAVFGIPAVKGIDFGAGFAAAAMRGSEHNDPFVLREGRVVTETNHAGGILGGITNGMPLLFRCAFKPTPSIAREQKTVRLSTMTEEFFRVQGRHDPCIVPRAVPCVEAAAAIAVYDALLDARKI
ncbi:MAG: chorismate synthase [Clostridia bacterium]|nr:chorismate synthase [Clostridia bacterium]